MNETTALLRFIENSPSPYHVCENLACALTEKGYTELSEADAWTLTPGAGYFVRRNMSSILAFRVPTAQMTGIMITASHSDSPTYKVKENMELVSPVYTRLHTEPYGGMIASTWLDRPLSVAGRLLVRENGSVVTKLVNVDRDLLLIPNVAPHMARLTELNPSVDLMPLFGDGDAKESFLGLIAACAGVEKDDIIGTDLFLYNRMKGCVWGAGDAFISSPKLDDLQCAYASMQAFLQAEPQAEILPLCAVLDNEEVGSQTKQGAASTFLSDVLRRVTAAMGMQEADVLRAVSAGMMVSADNAHAVHPNHPELADPTHRPVMNGGIVIKHNAAQHYTTDAVSRALFSEICAHAEVPIQSFFNRSDMRGGSTLGNIANTQVSLNTVDIGMAQLAMHSSYETAGAKDTAYLIRALKVFFETRIAPSAGGAYTLIYK